MKKINLLKNALECMEEIHKNLGEFLDLFEEDEEAYNLLNSIPGYPKNWASVDEELYSIWNYKNSIKEALKEELKKECK